MFKRWNEMVLWKRILIALVLGVVAGLYFNVNGHTGAIAFVKPFGTVFLNGIKMLMVPLIFLTLASGIMSVADPAKMGRIGLKTIVIFLGSTGLAVAIGIGLALWIGPGIGASLGAAPEAPEKALTLSDLLVGLVPANPINAMATGNVLQVIVFALLIGISVNLAGEGATPVRKLIDAGAEVMYKLTHLVMEMAPYGVFALIAWVIGTNGLAVLGNLAKVIGVVYLACLLHMAVVYSGLLFLVARLNPLRFFPGVLDAMMVAFSTTSSAGTLPVTLANTQDNLGVSKTVASFVLPLGATMNMNGTAIYLGIAAVFTAQATGVVLSAGQYVTIILTAVLAAVGTASVPAAGLIMMPMVLGSVDLSLASIALFAGIDRILDMARTTVNITGDAVAAVLIAKSEGELDVDTYNAAPTT